MALQLPPLDAAGRNLWEHQWRPYDDYLNIHSSRMRRLEREGVVLEERLSYLTEHGYGMRRAAYIRIVGRIRCHQDVSVQVNKVLAVRRGRRGLEVRGIDYSYHAWLASTEQDILRYDMAHGDGLHCHVFDLATGESALLPAPLDLLPTLDGFVRIACRLAAEAQAGSAP